MTSSFRISSGECTLIFSISKDAPVRLTGFGLGVSALKDDGKWKHLVEIQAAGFDWDDHHGSKYSGTMPGSLLRYVSHGKKQTRLGEKLEIRQEGGGLLVTSHFQALDGLPAFQTWTEVGVADGPSEVDLEYVSTFCLETGGPQDSSPWDRSWLLHLCDNTWCGECQWRSGTFAELGLKNTWRPDAPFVKFSLKRITIGSQGSWPTHEFLPLGIIEKPDESLFWQIEHNGSWHWELSNLGGAACLRVSGPTYRESHWHHRLVRGKTFISSTATVGCVPGDHRAALRTLTSARRLIRAPHQSLTALPVIFNDYMNTLSADPTTEKLLPLIDAAADAGCEIFVVDAGWFAKPTASWWETVGEWRESEGRFPAGLGEVMNHIRRRGMVPGLWIEIEVVGIHSPAAASLPVEWFFQRNGQRIADHGRFQLDFRNPDARHYADRVVDRLIADYGLGYIKNDYNIQIGPGTDREGVSMGSGLFGHNRAFLDWISETMARHPGLTIEACASGGMRMDYATLSVHPIQSVSDQQDERLNAVIASSAASAVTPEQAAIWSYPDGKHGIERTIFNMVGPLLLRIHQSGWLNKLSAQHRLIVSEGIRFHKRIRHLIPRSLPFWPIGLASFGDSWAAYGMEVDGSIHLAVWRLDTQAKSIDIPLPNLSGRRLDISVAFPPDCPPCYSWNPSPGILQVDLPEPFSARIIAISPLAEHAGSKE